MGGLRSPSRDDGGPRCEAPTPHVPNASLSAHTTLAKFFRVFLDPTPPHLLIVLSDMHVFAAPAVIFEIDDPRKVQRARAARRSKLPS